MKKKPLLLLLTISIVLYFFVACSEDFPKDEILGNWQAHRFHYFNPDTIFAIELPIHDSLISSINDSTVDTITTRFGWYKLSLYEDLTLFSEELTGDTSNGFW
ncbi:MAG: hypothetical protein U9R19_12500, partial [Bacteroidota bacterium]|nr:hypothetical protein [Bacteroidota bacterium]